MNVIYRELFCTCAGNRTVRSRESYLMLSSQRIPARSKLYRLIQYILNVSLTVHHELITQNTNVMHLILFIR